MIRILIAVVLTLAAGGAAPALADRPALAGDIPAELLHDAPGGAVARPRMLVVGSETMTPFTRAIAGHMSAHWAIPQPEEVAAGTHAGFVKFCAGAGGEFPDIVAATRRMRQTEFDQCIANGIADIIEVPIGFSAVAFVQRRGDPPVRLTPKILYQALAAEVPQGHDLVANPYQRWRDIDRKLPDLDIRVLLPGAAVGTRNFFDDVFLQGGCRKFPIIKLTFYDTERVKLCTTLRGDGRMVTLGARYDEELPQRLIDGAPGAIGILPWFVATAHQDKLQLLPVNDVLPSPETIASDDYEGVNTLYYYIKRAHMRNHAGDGVVRGLRQFIIEATSEEARGSGGYLEGLGLTPIPAEQRARERRSALRLERFTR